MRPTIKLLLDAVKERGLSIRVVNGQACLHGNAKEATPELLAAMRHFRAEIISDLNIVETVPYPLKIADEEEEVVTVDVPPGAVIVVADAKGYTDANMRGPAYMWTFLGASRWHRVADVPIPTNHGNQR